jgi:heparan-alpha-glucosaminide N-acetyltransferase
MDEGAKRMEEGINLALDDNAKDDLLKKQERNNISGDSNIKQQIVEENDDQEPALVKQKTKRVATLDAFRGLTIVVIK